MPYADSLKSLSEWYIQLLAESLGKRLDKQGNVVNYGRTPIVAVGTTDMHAQTQEHQEGPQDKSSSSSLSKTGPMTLRYLICTMNIRSWLLSAVFRSVRS